MDSVLRYRLHRRTCPSSSSCRVFLYNERLELDWDKGQDEPSMVIPYKSMTSIENMDDQKIFALRVIGFGIIGAERAIQLIYSLLAHPHQYPHIITA